MSENSSGTGTDAPSANDTTAAVSGQLSGQPTSLVETTFAETIGLSMHNAVTSQQSSQMTTAASITNACARLLQTGVPVKKAPAKKEKKAKEPEAQPEQAQPESDKNQDAKPKKKFNLMNFLKPKNKNTQDAERTEPTALDASSNGDDNSEGKS